MLSAASHKSSLFLPRVVDFRPYQNQALSPNIFRCHSLPRANQTRHQSKDLGLNIVGTSAKKILRRLFPLQAQERIVSVTVASIGD
jgi:hypothetical protein